MKSHLIGLIPDFKVIRCPLFISGLLSGIAGKVETARRSPSRRASYVIRARVLFRAAVPRQSVASILNH